MSSYLILKCVILRLVTMFLCTFIHIFFLCRISHTAVHHRRQRRIKPLGQMVSSESNGGRRRGGDGGSGSQDVENVRCIRNTLSSWLPGTLTTLSYFYYCFLIFLATPCGIWDLSSPTRDRTCAPCSGSVES